MKPFTFTEPEREFLNKLPVGTLIQLPIGTDRIAMVVHTVFTDVHGLLTTSTALEADIQQHVEAGITPVLDKGGMIRFQNPSWHDPGFSNAAQYPDFHLELKGEQAICIEVSNITTTVYSWWNETHGLLEEFFNELAQQAFQAANFMALFDCFPRLMALADNAIYWKVLSDAALPAVAAYLPFRGLLTLRYTDGSFLVGIMREGAFLAMTRPLTTAEANYQPPSGLGERFMGRIVYPD